MIKQIKRGMALTILSTMMITLIGGLAIGFGSNNVTKQNSILNEQTVEVETTCQQVILKPLDANNVQFPLESITDSTTKIEEVEVEETTTEIIQQEENILSQFTPEEWDILYRVARCEAGNWCKTDNECGKCDKCADAKEGQKNVIYVILNRLNNNKFPNDIKSIVFAKSQFTVTNNKEHFYSVYISDYCKANVQEAVKDYQAGISAQGALYFNCISANYWTSWAEYVFTDAVGHHFFINKNKN